jgi:hypothetical protein
MLESRQMGDSLGQAAETIGTDHPCWKCGYNLRGLVWVNQCPECGESIDLTRLPWRFPWRGVAAFLATLAVVILALGTLVLDYAAGVTAHFRFVLAVGLVAAVVALPVWYWTRSRPVLVVFAGLTMMLLVLPFVSLPLCKPYVSFYKHVDNGMTQQQAIGQLDRHFPNRASDGWPIITLQTRQRLSIVLDPSDGRYNSEVIVIEFEDGRVVDKRYLPD